MTEIFKERKRNFSRRTVLSQFRSKSIIQSAQSAN